MNEAGVKNFDQESVAGAGLAEKIYGKAKEWGGALKKAGVMFKENPELQKQAITTVAGSLASIAGVKSFYDVPEYLRERFMVRGIFGHGKGVEGSVEDLLAKNWQRREDAGHEPEAEYNIEEQTEVRQAIADLNKRLKLTKEGGQKGSEQRNMIAKLLKEYSLAGKNDRQERKEKITEILDNYTTTKVTGLQAARESLNTFLIVSGSFALRGAAYGIMDGAERYTRLNKEARIKTKQSGQAQEVNFLKDVVAGSFKETWDELRLKDESKKKTGLQKGLDFIRASGKVMRYLGLGYSGLHNETLSDNIDNMLYTLEGKTSFSDMEKNFVGNIERTYESYKSMLGRVGHLAKAGGGSVIKGAGAAGQFVSNYVFGGPAEAIESKHSKFVDDNSGTITYNVSGVLTGGIFGQNKILSNEEEVFEQLRKDNPDILPNKLILKHEAVKADAYVLALLDKRYNEAMNNNPQEAAKIKEHIIINKNNFENAYGKSIKLNLRSLAGDLEKQDAGEVKAEEAVGPKTPLTPLNKGGEVAGKHTPNPSPEGKEPAEVEPKDIEIGLVRKGKGIEQSLYKQIKANFKEYGFNGDEKNRVQINKFAQQQAHVLAEKMGYVDSAQGKEIRVRSADKVAYILGKDKDGELTVKEYSEVNGKFKLAGTRYFSDGFKGGGENEYEYVHSNKQIAKDGQKEILPATEKSAKQISLSDDERTDKLNREELENVQQARGHIPPEVKTAESAEYNLMENDDWIQEKIGNNINDRLWRKAVGLSDARSVKSPADLAESPRAYSLAEKYSDEKLTLEILDKNNDYQADEVVIKHQGAVVEKYNRLQIEEMFGEENMEKTSLKMEKLAQNLIEDRLRKFEKITDGKVELTRARELGIEIFDQDGLSATDKAKLEFIKDRGFTSDISYEKIKERFKIYDELKGTDIDLKQIDKYYNAVKDIKEPNVSAGLIKVWDEPSDINLQHLLEQLKPQDPKAGFEELTAGKRQNGDLVINYITKGHNEGNYMMVFSAKGQVLLERPGGVIDKIDHISDLKKVLSAPAEMVRGGEEIGTEERLKYNEFTDHQDKTEANGDADNEENSQEPRIRWFTK